jgi:hypothetical protein
METGTCLLTALDFKYEVLATLTLHIKSPDNHSTVDTVPSISTLLKSGLVKLIMSAPYIGVLAVLMVFQIPQVTEHDSTCCTDVAPGSYPLPTQFNY